MPITPFHFGPAVLIKSIAPNKFSMSVFIATQVLIDVETLRNIVFGSERLHTYFHSYTGATIASAIVALAYFLYVRFEKPRANSNIRVPPTLVIVGSALVGGWSHVLLDSIMHADLQPWWPFADTNQMLQILSIDTLHLFCIFTGIIGGVIWMLRTRLTRSGGGNTV